MYGLLITATGWTWEYIDNFMTLPRYNELRGYWAVEPPTHVLVAAYLMKDSKHNEASGDIGDLINAFPME